MPEIQDGGPAFPNPHAEELQGMSLRDYFSAGVMQAVITSTTVDLKPEYIAKVSYLVADAMLVARQSTP
ncbi:MULTISPECIES: hypothetical protein [unclassified Pseudomonas]|uniref:hypothetical protein n=1 Tax=unclassified Pseudomonas TaxID=196821 RepID=UPI002448915E|nr:MULTISPECIES: hypothetical protein [unclassified Pseudomonas]MDH0896345.1 hypothetical protein [Pseudomonas sp. GD03875]MDH1066105.1 hypothetical protein [Pseudomonas sp. GD03985]